MTAPKPVVLITGSEGRIGSAIAASLADAYTVVGFERACHGAGCIDADITSADALAAACAALRERHGARIASVIHLAAFYDFSGAPHPAYEAVNVDGTAKLLRALQGFEVGQFIYASTMLVHAPGAPGRPIDETAPLAPAWPYPASKLAAERVVALGARAVDSQPGRNWIVFLDPAGHPFCLVSAGEEDSADAVHVGLI